MQIAVSGDVMRGFNTTIALLTFIPIMKGSDSFQVGQRFPEITLPQFEDGRPGSIAQFRREKIILHIFASW
jgi:hypothetical protein